MQKKDYTLVIIVTAQTSVWHSLALARRQYNILLSLARRQYSILLSLDIMTNAARRAAAINISHQTPLHIALCYI